MTEKPPDLMEILESGVRNVLTDKKAKIGDRLKAIDSGTKLLLMKHKISDTGDEAGSYFKGK